MGEFTWAGHTVDFHRPQMEGVWQRIQSRKSSCGQQAQLCDVPNFSPRVTPSPVVHVVGFILWIESSTLWAGESFHVLRPSWGDLYYAVIPCVRCVDSLMSCVLRKQDAQVSVQRGAEAT